MYYTAIKPSAQATHRYVKRGVKYTRNGEKGNGEEEAVYSSGFQRLYTPLLERDNHRFCLLVVFRPPLFNVRY
jgi:hypothetical protein